jgi:hypothetical protein
MACRLAKSTLSVFIAVEMLAVNCQNLSRPTPNNLFSSHPHHQVLIVLDVVLCLNPVNWPPLSPTPMVARAFSSRRRSSLWTTSLVAASLCAMHCRPRTSVALRAPSSLAAPASRKTPNAFARVMAAPFGRASHEYADINKQIFRMRFIIQTFHRRASDRPRRRRHRLHPRQSRRRQSHHRRRDSQNRPHHRAYHCRAAA